MAEEFACIDVETTGLKSDRDEIVEVCARKFDSEGNFGEKFHRFCKPLSGEIPKEVEKIHGISYEKVKDCPSYLKDGVREELAKFIGKRTVIGHNLIAFDIGFLKIEPAKMEDTLVMCRRKYRKDNALWKACRRAGIKFDKGESHSASYDVDKTIELFLRMKGFEKKESVQLDVFVDENEICKAMTEDPGKVKETQIYSFSRINLFTQCPFKWHKRYIQKVSEPPQPHLLTGSICHKIAELTAAWCYRETFASKLISYLRKINIALPQKLIDEAKKRFNDLSEPDSKLVAYYVYENQGKIKEYFNEDKIVTFIEKMNEVISDEEYEKASMPDLESFDAIIKQVFNVYECNDIDVLKDVNHIMGRFYQYSDFSINFGQVSLIEQKLAFKRGWKRSRDWNSPENFFRGIIDLIEYMGERTVVITDYKSSRVMLSKEKLKHDMQLKIYVLLVYCMLPKGSVDKIIVRINYLRYNRYVEYIINDIEQVAKDAKEWIENNVKKIENAIVKNNKESFAPKRNEYCATCFIAEEGSCPLFSKKHINDINDIEKFSVTDIEDCHTAWKRIEVNKVEIKNLAKKCKAFLKGCSTKVKIDELAVLDFWSSESRSFFSRKAYDLFIKKGLKPEDFVRYFNLTAANFEHMIENTKDLELSMEELEEISVIKIKQELNALTKEEVEKGDYINK